MTRIQLGEAKRRYPAHFISKLSDCDGFLLVERSYSSESENGETDTWLDYARDCRYIDAEAHKQLTSKVASVGAMLGTMLKRSDEFTDLPADPH